MKSLNDRIDEAHELHKKGYTCSQCVVMAFDDVTGVDPQLCASFSAGFGGGMGGQGEVCGAVSGMTMIKGLTAFKSPQSKMEIYSAVRDLSAEFTKINGSLGCRELRGNSSENVGSTTISKKPCMQYIIDAITIIHNNLGL